MTSLQKISRLGQSSLALFIVLGGFTFFSTGTAFAASPQAPDSVVSTSLSHNWSGYIADSGTDYTSVTGTWTVPTVTASASASADATWVGIGGVSSDDLIQAGTQAIAENGSPEYQAWYELLPDESTPVSLTVSPGDSITATITEQSSNNWLISIRDNTTGQSYSTVVTYTSTLSSAEWIQEMPSDQVGLIPLDNFGSVSFNNAQATTNGQTLNLAQANARAITMVAGTSVLSAPSAIGADGASFQVTRTDASAEVQSRIVRLRRGGFSRGGDGVQGFAPSASSTFPSIIPSDFSSTFPSTFPAMPSIPSYFIDPSQAISSSTNGQTQTYQVGPFTVQVTFSQS